MPHKARALFAPLGLGLVLSVPLVGCGSNNGTSNGTGGKIGGTGGNDTGGAQSGGSGISEPSVY